MHIRLVAVGDRQPAWVGDAFDEYARRLPPQWRFRLDTVAPARRSGDSGVDEATRAEGLKILRQLKPSEKVVLLDETGTQFTSAQLAAELNDWQSAGDDLTFVIGGADGVSADCVQRASLCWSLSRLTLPHGLARVVCVEQLYRAWTLLTGHPYHRG